MHIDEEKSGSWPYVAIPAGSDPAATMRKYGIALPAAMTLEEAIRHALEVAEGHGACAVNHAQLAKWLEDYRRMLAAGHGPSESPENDGQPGLTVIEADTRERIEVDMIAELAEYEGEIGRVLDGEADITDVRTNVQMAMSVLLDRQAAITRQECSPEAIDYMLNTIGELEERVDELSGKMEAEHSLRLHWKAQAEELTAERDALKKLISQSDAPKSGESAESGTPKDEMRDFDDTREKLEAWAHEEIAEKWAQSDREATMIMDDLLDLLDRQAAITTAECTSEDESCCEACRAAQKRETAKLTAERDTWKAAYLEKNETAEHWRHKYVLQRDTIDSLTAERDMLKGANEFLANGFKGIQAERDELKRKNADLWKKVDELTTEWSDALDGWEKDEKRIDELTDERDEWKAKLETYGKVPDQGEREELQPVESGDTREELEADLQAILRSAYMLAWMHGNENRRGSSFEKLHAEFYNLLDRQAAITEREMRHESPFVGLVRGKYRERKEGGDD